ncbi:Pre-mRNA splicing factor [Nesidiocoris tenuis]|uniref:Pre-mRNA splicing factor n=1 Tax=Nesidiocoris tenuis TaxID=355587 RepID=A0ABN7AAS4_9HEMI|nr:Pre-mRNA splicing factor [Nesidiocoris tenuis]
MDWMYKNSDAVDPEEYLLGKAIDKNFERREIGEKDVLPSSIFANSGSNLQVDVFRKVKEDPLEQIKQKEIEMRKQLLKNPVKLKKLQNLLKAKEKENARKEKKKKKKGSKDIDALLAAKYSKLVRKYGSKQLMQLTNASSESEGEPQEGKASLKRKKGKNDSDFNKNRSSSEDSSSSSSSLGSNVHRNNHDRTKSFRSRGKAEVARKEKRKYRQHHDDSSDESSPRKHEKRRNQRTHVDVDRQKVVKQTENRGLDSDDRKHRSKAERRRRSSTSSSASECEDQGAMSNLKDARRLKCKRDDDSSDSEKIASKKAYGLVLPKSFDASKAASSSGQDDSWRKKRDAELESKKKAEADKKAAYLSWKKQPAKLSQEEKEAKLREMMANGQQREKERKKNVTRYKMEERKEEAQTKYEDKDFIRKQLSKVASKSVEDRIKSNANRIQRSQSSMEQHFTSRH